MPDDVTGCAQVVCQRRRPARSFAINAGAARYAKRQAGSMAAYSDSQAEDPYVVRPQTGGQ